MACNNGEFVIGVHYRGDLYVHAVQLRCGKISGKSVVYVHETDWYGGGGGSRSSFANCPSTIPGVTGISARGGDYVDAISTQFCAGVDASTRQVSTSKTGGAGSPVGGAGGTRIDLRCPAGEVLGGFKIIWGSWLDSLQGFCVRP
ncbi:MAG: hypothetical protein ABI718_04965 [Acidobacteriota bacterium]